MSRDMTDDETPAPNGSGNGHDAEAALDIAELEALRAEVAAAKEQALRYAAEADNTRRRAEKEMNDARAYAITKFARDLFGVADNLARALAVTPDAAADPALKNLATGIEMTERELIAAFDRNGLKRIHPLSGDKFDPHVHQAVSEIAAEGVPPGAVAQVMQTGYELFGRVLRPAMVMVAAKTAAPDANANQQQGSGAYAKAAAATGDAFDRKA
jgi:molecular chaperone GrpE